MMLYPKVSHLLSILLHPLLTPTLCAAIVFYFGRTILPISSNQTWLLLGLIFTFTVLLPSISIYTLYNSRFLNSLKLTEKNDRITSLIVATVYHTLLTYLIVDKLGIELVISEIVAGMAITTALVTLLTPFIRISVHAAGVSAVLGVLVGLQHTYAELELLYPILAFVFFTGWLMSARLSLQYHPPMRIVPGFFLGFTICCFTVIYLAR